MAYFPTENRLGVKAFTNIDTATAVPFGTIIRGQDAASGKGGGEFIYLPGVASTLVGCLVTYDPVAKSTTLAPNTASLGKPVAVAMAAVATAGNFGWYQIGGVAAIRKTAIKISPGSKIYISATAGSVFATSTTGKYILNAISVGTTALSAASTVNVLIQRPFMDPFLI